jgi:hypothetical protein
VCWIIRAGIVVLLAALFSAAGCGDVTLGPGGTAGADGGIAAHDVAVESEAPRDAAAECPPTSLSCSGSAGACPQGQAQGTRRTCGGAAVAVCCPVNDCELALCDVCPLCAL